MDEIDSGIDLPNFFIDKIPDIRVKSIRFQNFQVFEDYTFDFSDSKNIRDFICLVGPNGSGKSTVLNSIQLLFTRFEGRDSERIKFNLGKSVRHVGTILNGVYGEEDFLITAQIQSFIGNYEIQINKSGFIKDHPKEIKEIVYRICYFARFDRELNNFQLSRDRWPIFKELYESVTGFTIEENQDIEKYCGQSEDPLMKKIAEEYILAFFIHKQHETIHHKECSAGEKKIIKSFSTLLTLEYMPKIILVDNFEMHVEKNRHFKLIESMKKCFPYSQIFCTTHSNYISRSSAKNCEIYDLRLITSSEIIKREPWRLCIMDEINDSLVKLEIFKISSNVIDLIEYGKKLLVCCNEEINDLHLFQDNLKYFLKEVQEVFVNGILR